MAMKKARFVRDMLKFLQAKSEEFKINGIKNGNAVNKVVRDAEKASIDSGLFSTGRFSDSYVNKDGTPREVYDFPNWRTIFINYLEQ